MTAKFKTDQGIAHKAAFGLIVLASDETIEAELRQVFNRDGIVLYHTRIPSQPEVTTATLLKMQQDLPQSAALLPIHNTLNVIAYACTSGATVIGPETVERAIQSVHKNTQTTDPMRAVMAALNHLKLKNIGLLTPYIQEVSLHMMKRLEQNGFSIAAFSSFEQSQEKVVARIKPQSVYDAICDLGGADDVECVFVSCTNLRSFDVIDRAEQKIGKPIISSNQAVAWHMLHLAGLETKNQGPGLLFSK